jgi:hypothetical protein
MVKRLLVSAGGPLRRPGTPKKIRELFKPRKVAFHFDVSGWTDPNIEKMVAPQSISTRWSFEAAPWSRFFGAVAAGNYLRRIFEIKRVLEA